MTASILKEYNPGMTGFRAQNTGSIFFGSDMRNSNDEEVRMERVWMVKATYIDEREPCVAAGACQVVSLWVLMNKPAAASQTPEEPGADRAELLGQTCQSC